MKDCDCQGVGHTPFCRVGQSIEHNRLSAEVARLTGDVARLQSLCDTHAENAAEALRMYDAERAIVTKVNDAIGRAGIHCAIYFWEAIDLIASQRDLAKLEVERMRAVLMKVQQTLDDWSDLGKAHEWGCGNSRPCDACDLNDALDSALSTKGTP